MNLSVPLHHCYITGISPVHNHTYGGRLKIAVASCHTLLPPLEMEETPRTKLCLCLSFQWGAAFETEAETQKQHDNLVVHSLLLLLQMDEVMSFMSCPYSSFLQKSLNPFTVTSCQISRLKCACTRLQYGIFFCLIITNLPSVLCVLMKICSFANAKKKAKRLR